MKQFLDRFILYFPVLFIKQYPYAWIAGVALWSWPPNISAVFFLIVLIGILSLHWREAAWISEMRRQHAPHGETFYIERLPVPIERAVRNIAILLVISALLAWFLNGIFHLGFWQTFILVFGFAICYLDARFFWPVTIYIVTGGGIAIYYRPLAHGLSPFLQFQGDGARSGGWTISKRSVRSGRSSPACAPPPAGCCWCRVPQRASPGCSMARSC